jgi:formate hydrogenlyase transcriptional activator
MVHPWMNYDSEIQRMLNWPDVFMKGVAYRMKAQKALKHSRPMEEVLFDLNKSRKFLSKAGAMLELARTHILLSRLWLDQGKVRNARPLLQKAWEIMSPVNRGLFPDDLRKYLKEENREDILVQTFVEMGNVLGTVREKKKLLENSINLAMQFTSAERGGIFLSSGNGRLKLAASRNFDTAMVQADGFQPYLKEMERVVYSRKGIIRGYAKKSGAGFESLADTNKSGWITLIPIALQEKISGVLYLTGRLTRLLSSKMAIPVLKAIGNQIAIALDNVRAYEEIAALKDRLKEEAHFYRMDSQHSPLLSHIVGRSEAILQVQKKMGKVAVTDSTVLITGETGVGKELVAQGIHRMSHRASGAFIALSITSLAEGVMESELFGHEQGAFTGASKRRLGRFELAHGGTLFLDEIQNLSEEMQAKLLRALEEKTFERVGGSKPIKSDFRLITATNRSLEEMVKGEKFRSDLYYRLSVFPIEVPPLRKRSEDIPPLALHFLELFGKKFDKTIQGISKNHMRKLIEYPWPGNVRELKHVIERSVILSESRFLSLPDLKVVAHDERRPHKFKGGFKEMERTYILQGLEECGWKIKGKNGAAELLKLKPTTLYSKMKKLGLHRNITYAKS